MRSWKNLMITICLVVLTIVTIESSRAFSQIETDTFTTIQSNQAPSVLFFLNETEIDKIVNHAARIFLKFDFKEIYFIPLRQLSADQLTPHNVKQQTSFHLFKRLLSLLI